MKVLIGIPCAHKLIGDSLLRQFMSHDISFICNPSDGIISRRFLLDNIKNADAYIAGSELIDAEVISAAKELKIIARYGTGFEKIDLEAARGRSIFVTTTKGINANSVAEHAVMLILATLRKLTFYRNSMIRGVWEAGNFHELSGMTIGIIGFGHIGQLVAKKISALTNHIIAFDPNLSQNTFDKAGVLSCELDQLLKTSDVVTLHLPGSETPILGRRELSLIKKEAVIVNTSRGSLIDSDALYEALVHNKIYGAGLDVFEEEPMGAMKFLNLENVVVTPHIAGGSIESHSESSKMCVKAILDVLIEKKEPENVVNEFRR